MISCRHCCTPPEQRRYKRKEGNGRRRKDIKHCDVRRREREEMFGPQHSRSWKSDAVGQSVGETEAVREAKVVTALLQTHRRGCWIRDGVKQKRNQNKTTLCRAEKLHAP